MVHGTKEKVSSFERQARLFRATTSSVRIAILRLLAQGDLHVNEIVRELRSAERSNVSKHLAVLREEGIVTVAGDSQRRFYLLAQPCLIEALAGY